MASLIHASLLQAQPNKIDHQKRSSAKRWHDKLRRSAMFIAKQQMKQ
jgi:hypothetical protein